MTCVEFPLNLSNALSVVSRAQWQSEPKTTKSVKHSTILLPLLSLHAIGTAKKHRMCQLPQTLSSPPLVVLKPEFLWSGPDNT